MIYVTSDLHGYPKDKFLRFLFDSGFSDNDELYVLGDVIDRNGDGGVEMMRWIMGQPNVHFLLGNHEDMMLECYLICISSKLSIKRKMVYGECWLQ